jgi:hypothetical protein
MGKERKYMVTQKVHRQAATTPFYESTVNRSNASVIVRSKMPLSVYIWNERLYIPISDALRFFGKNVLETCIRETKQCNPTALSLTKLFEIFYSIRSIEHDLVTSAVSSKPNHACIDKLLCSLMDSEIPQATWKPIIQSILPYRGESYHSPII